VAVAQTSVASGLWPVVATKLVAGALLWAFVLVSVVGSMFPAITVLLARVILDEQIGRVQALGLVLALAAVGLIVGG